MGAVEQIPPNVSGPSLQAGHEYMADTTTNLHTCKDVVLAREVILETATQLVYTCKETETLKYPLCLKSAFLPEVSL